MPSPAATPEILPDFTNLRLRCDLIRAVREFFDAHDFLEVETPYRIPAPAPEAYIEAEPADGWFLHTSPELCMKRLLAAGLPRLFQICKCFRKNERGARHLPEFTLLEWYAAGCDYTDMMAQTEALIIHVAEALGRKNGFTYQNSAIDLKSPWPRITVAEAFEQYAGQAVQTALANDSFDMVMTEKIEPQLDKNWPVFLYDYPVERGALARVRPDNPGKAERFELYMGGLELCNGFSELCDAAEQRKRFAAEQKRRRDQGLSAYPTAERFLKALETMPPAGGNALGLDRLIMLFANTTRIDEVVAFTPEQL